MNPIESYSKDFSQWEIDSNVDDGYEDNLRAFELSQLKQKQRKPRKSNFFPLKSRISILTGGVQMNVIHEDDTLSKSQEEDGTPGYSITSHGGMESIKEEKLSLE